MPTYDYECLTCGHVFEAFQMMSDEPLKTCPKCEGEVRRMIAGGLGVIFKGSGFYVTDSKGGKSTSSSSSSSSSKKESTSSSKSD